MKTLRECIRDASKNQVGLGHFNISNIEGVWAIFRAAQKFKLPVIIGVSEGERDFVGVKQIAAIIKSIREEFDYPIFLNADHTYSFERVKQVVDAGYDAVIIDGAKLSFEENVKMTKQCVDYARKVNPDMIVEGELGYIGTSSKLLDKLPDGVVVEGAGLTSPEQAKQFVEQTGVDLLAPAVGNVHGMLKETHDPRLDIARIGAIRKAAGVPLVLHGGSGTVDEDFVEGIKKGIAIVHINTELRVSFRKALEMSLKNSPDEIAPYKFLAPTVEAMEKTASERLKLFNLQF